MIDYFVSYSIEYGEPTKSTFLTRKFSRENPISTKEDIQSIQDLILSDIRKRNPDSYIQSVVIVFWRRFEGQEEEPTPKPESQTSGNDVCG